MSWMSNALTKYQVDFAVHWLWVVAAIVALLVPLWVLSFRGLSGLGPVRRVMALSLRSVVVALFVFAIADIQLKKSTDRLTVIFLLDQSKSVPKLHRDAMVEYFNTVSQERTQTSRISYSL